MMVPAKNDNPTTEPCQPVANNQPVSISLEAREHVLDRSPTCNVTQELLAPARGELRDPMVLTTSGGRPVIDEPRSLSCRENPHIEAISAILK